LSERAKVAVKSGNWLTGAPRVQPSTTGAYMRAEKRKEFSLACYSRKELPERGVFCFLNNSDKRIAG
jgi:hypothetical protein